MSNVLIILTHAYPYAPPSEQFLNEEIKVLNDYFDKIILIPTSRSSWVGNMNKNKLDNVTVERIRRKNKEIEILKTFLSSILFNKNFYNELLIIFKKKLFFNLHALRVLLITCVNSKIIASKILKTIDSQEINKESNVFIYSYWLSYLSNTSILIKDNLINEGFQNVMAISRAHGSSDIFLPKSMKDYKVGLTDLQEKLDKIYSISYKGKQYLVDVGFKKNRIIVNRLGVNDNGTKKILNNKKEFCIVSCSSINKVKRVEIIAEALSYLIDAKIHWVHFGDGPLRKKIETKAQSCLPKNIKYTFMGAVNNQEILNFYKEGNPDLFINVSSMEGIPVSIMEAISFGIPVIATEVGGTNEVCKHQYNGFLMKKDFKIKTLVKNIKHFMEMPSEEYNIYSDNARQLFIKHFNSRKNFKKFARDIIELKKVVQNEK
ncbi:glycosyltransferase [Pseudalkalibacillus sp. R45]|uniref:glycosyltransferase n=1 Tax=Pseudalkalibacillus sp. R45 TaxID=3457433 RepID=UPI003FCC5117